MADLTELSNEELSALVATRLMGWVEYLRPSDHHKVWWSDERRLAIDFVSHWSPATRIDHAWEVVEKVRSDGFEYHVEGTSAGGYNSAAFRYMKESPAFTCWPPYPIHGSGFQDTAPRAICLAALRAVGVEDG